MHFFARFKERYIGDKAFYRSVLAVAVPIMVQNGITNFVSLLDNIMVGRLGTESMSGVSIVNQFIFIFNLLIFGAVSAAGIFTAQYHGRGDTAGVRDTFRFKVLITIFAALVCGAVLYLADDPLISLFLYDGSAEGDLALTLAEGKDYLLIMLSGLLPFAISNAYASTMRETGETVLPMKASIVAVVTNFILNSLLIFGLFGLPALGVRGAAIATVASRFAELAVLVIWGHTHRGVCPYLVGAYRSFRIPGALFGQIAVRGLPLMLNEFFWSLAVTMRNQCYATRGLDAVAAQNICSTIVNVFSIVYLALGSAIAIIIGNLLGAGKLEEARVTDRRLVAFSVLCSAAIGCLLAATSGLFPLLYNITENARGLAAYMIAVSALAMPFCAFANSAYFTIRSGGQVMITLLFDSVFMWTIVMPLSFFLSRATGMDIRPLYFICQMTEALKALLGFLLLRRGTWVRQLIREDAETPAPEDPAGE